MTAITRKVLADLWQRGTRARSLLIVLAVAAGVAAFGSVLSTYAVLVREVADGYRATDPADITLTVDAVDDALLAAVRAAGGVARVDARRVVHGRLRTGPIQWRPLMLFVPRDFADVAVSRFVPQHGAWPPAVGELLVERDALQVARARIGESVTIRTRAGQERTLRLAGTVHDPGQAQARMENVVYGYVSRETLELLGEDDRLDRLLLTVAGSGGEDRAREVAAAVAGVVTQAGHAVRHTEIHEGHPHASLMELLFRIQAGFGGLVLLLSGLIAVQLFTVQMASQVRQIGVLKALGARPAQLAGIYLGQAAVLGVAACVLAWPAGVLLGRVLSGWLAVYLNFDLKSAAAPAWVVLLQAVAGIAVPLLAAAWPVWRGIRVPVSEAVVQYGVGRRWFGQSAVDRLLARIGGRHVARPVLLALRNTLRVRGRTARTVLTLALAGVCFLAACDLRVSLIGTLDRLFAGRKYDLTIGLGSMQSFVAAERAALATAGVVAVEGWITTQATLPRPGASRPEPTAPHGAGMLRLHGGVPGQAGPTFPIQAPPAGTRMHAPELAAGRGLLPGDTDCIVVNEALAARAGVAVGSELTIQLGPSEKPWRVVGIAREPFAPAGGYIPLAVFEAAGHADQVNTLRLVLGRKDQDAVAAIKTELESQLQREGIRVSSSQATADGRFAFDQHFVMVYECLLAIAGIVLALGTFGLWAGFGLGLIERRREFGILRALGATPRTVGLIVLGEGCCVALVAWALAWVAACALTAARGLLLGPVFPSRLESVSDPLAPLLWLGIALAVGAASSFVPAWRAGRVTVREALAQA